MRRRALAPALVVLGAAGIAGGALPTWWTVRWAHSMLGEQTATLTGQQVSPSLLALALVAVAGIGAVAAARGGWRRVIGVLIALVGVLAVVAAVTGTASLPTEVIRDEHLQVERVLGGSRSLFGPVLAAIGSLLTTAGGALVAAGFFAGRGMGGRFDRAGVAGGADSPSAPGASAGATGASTGAGPAAAVDRTSPATSTADPDETATALWKALDSGVDPTDGQTIVPTVDVTADPASVAVPSVDSSGASNVDQTGDPSTDPTTERPENGSGH